MDEIQAELRRRSERYVALQDEWLVAHDLTAADVAVNESLEAEMDKWVNERLEDK